MAAEAPPPPPVRRRSDWPRRLLDELLVLFIALVIVFAGTLILLDTAPGHRFIIDRIAAFETASGLKVRIGRIDGSIFGKSQLKNVAVSDTRGTFLTSPEIDLDWTPGAWLANKLHIDSVTADKVTLIRLPKLRPSLKPGPILPGFDIHIGELAIRHLEVAPSVAGRSWRGRVTGKADIAKGRAVADLAASLDGGGDHLAFHLDAEPDRDRFDLAARAISPANGVLPALVGSNRAINLAIGGKGSWTRWRGTAALDLAGRPAARLALGLDRGVYRLAGQVQPSPFFTGRLMRLTGPAVVVKGSATFADRAVDGELVLTSSALRTIARGAIDLASSRFRHVRIGVDLLKPEALFDNMRGRDVRLLATLDGPFGTADYSYRLTSPSVAFDTTGFIDVRAEGRGRLAPWPMRVPLLLQARAITGAGDVAGAILANARLAGWLSLTPKLIQGQNLQLTSARLNGKLSLLIDLVTGRFELLVSGGMNRYLIPGLGVVDILTDLKVVPDPSGRGSRVVGVGKAWVRRLDNSVFRDLTGGLPSLSTNLERGPDGVLRFTNLQLFSPKLRLSGSGARLRDGSFHVAAGGRQAKYGPLKLVLDGDIAHPRIDLLLDRPNDALGITGMHLLLSPTPAGFDYRASGGSKLGPFTSNGRILLAGGPTTVSIAALEAGGAHASGDLTSYPGGFSGRLTLGGGTLGGTLDFAPANGAQRIDAHLTAADAAFPGALAVHSGRADGFVVLGQDTTVEGVIDARGVKAGGLTLARVTANARLINGSGQVRAAFSGGGSGGFAFSMVADVSSDTIRLAGSGRIAKQPLVLRQPAVLTRSGDGWTLAPATLDVAGGNVVLSGRSGSHPEVHAQVASMPLQALDLVLPGMGLTGTANGHVDYAWSGSRSGSINLTIRGLSRAGLVLASKPIDLGIAAIIQGDKAAMRAVAGSGGAIIGRAQARFAPIGNGPLAAELLNAPLFAQLRYVGPADTLWRLSGSEILDLSGPIAVAADIGGRWSNPVIRGSLRTQNARLESAVTGMAIGNLAAQAHFAGPQLVFTQLTGQTSGGGSINGSGSVTFSGGKTALDLSFNASQALLLNRDDIAARVTGPLKIRSDGQGGTISGTLHLDKGRFQLGRASSAAAVPQLNVREIGLDDADIIEPQALHPWKLALKLAGGNLNVTGLGINSIWHTDLDIGGVADAPRFTGRATLTRGDYDFAGRNFKLDRGTIRFQGESPPDPQLDIHAQAQLQGLDAAVIVAGTGLKPEITFTSSPPLPQDELLSRILFGTSITNLSAPEALQLASAVAALQGGSGSLDPINALRKAVGLDRLRIVPADVATGQKTAIGAGKYITRKFFVEVVTDGQGYSATQVEYQITRWLSILSTVSTVGRSSASVQISKDY
ncbi:MAG: translocation/assembly module TamB domain-containing protein [Sphingomonas sp.]|nr:translocation/assembly module TamB domain-containing protein [Sphingomonas sp.]